MIRIHPKDRFNQNQNRVPISHGLLQDALASLNKVPDHFQLAQLSGGFMNSNYLAHYGSERFVLRIYSSDARTAQKEFDLLRHLANYPVLVPKVFTCLEVQSRPVLVMEYLDGITLEDRLLGDPMLPESLFFDLGCQLGEIHNITFAKAGFLGPGLDVGTGFANFSAMIGQFIQGTLNDLRIRPDKLDLATNERFLNLFLDMWQQVEQSETQPQLVHCDFNPKNILVSRGPNPKVLGIIDWEFSDAGNGLIDLGNFFRFSYDYPDYARDSFISGYKATHPALPSDWENLSRLLDLGAMCGFLERQEDYQKSFFTARTVIEGTLQHLGY